MTASSLQVTPGNGLRLATNSYTEGAVTVHDQKLILGEQLLPTYTVVTGPTTGPVSAATLDAHLLQIMAGASLRVRIRRIELYQTGLATTATLGQIQIVRLTTAGTGGGSTGAPSPLDTAFAAAGATAQTLPTAKGTEGAFIHGATVYWMQTAGASAERTSPMLVIDFDRPRSLPLVISAGTSNGIAIKNASAIAGATVNIVVWLDESSF